MRNKVQIRKKNHLDSINICLGEINSFILAAYSYLSVFSDKE